METQRPGNNGLLKPVLITVERVREARRLAVCICESARP